MTRKLEREADRIVATMANRRKTVMQATRGEGYAIRDYCDALTGGDLECTQLDILTEMVKARIRILKRLRS